MKTYMMLAVAVVGALAALPSSAAAAATPATACTPAQLQAIASAAASAAGILAACERDTGFRLFPFAALPESSEQQRHVCLGRSCPTAISNLQDADLPECLVAGNLTPAAFLESVCKM